MSRSIARGSCPRPAHEFEGSDIVGHALDALDASAIRTITILGRRGPAPDRDDAQGTGRARPSRSRRCRSSTSPIPAASRPTRRSSRPAQVGHDPARIRRPPRQQAEAMVFDFFAKPIAIEGDGKAERMIVERTELDEKGAARGTGETYEVPASLVVSCIGYSTPPIEGVPYDERGASSSMTEGGSPTGSMPSAGRGAGRAGRSAPTAPTAMKSPTRSPRQCRREARDRAGAKG